MVRIVHPFPASIAVLTAAALMLVAHRGVPAWSVLLAGAGTISMSQITVGSLNDFLDRAADALEQPDKPIPAGIVSPRAAAWQSAIGGGLLVLLAASLGATSVALAVLGTAWGIVYDIWLKPTPWSVVGYLGGFLTLVTWVWAVAGHITITFLLVYPAGSLLLVAAHLANALPDVESDRKVGNRGLSVLLGIRRTFLASCVLILIMVLAGAISALLLHDGRTLGVIAVSALLGAFAWRTTAQNLDSRAARKRFFRTMALAIGILSVGCLLVAGDLGFS